MHVTIPIYATRCVVYTLKVFSNGLLLGFMRYCQGQGTTVIPGL